MEHYATYSPDDNKLRLYPAHRLDSEEYAKVKEAGFKWAPRQELFVAPMWTPSREDLLLEMCGEIEDEDKSLVSRAEERSERFEEYSEKRLKDAEQAKAAVSAIADGIPFGQPILVGHHSEKHARKDAERIENGMRRAVKMWKTSQYWQDRAAGAIAHAKYKELPGVRHRRIKGIESDKRKCEKTIKEAEASLRLWTACANEQDAEKQQAQARRLANTCRIHMPRKEGDREDFSHPPSVYDAVTGSCSSLYAPRTLAEVFEIVLGVYPRIIAHNERWIEHCNNRLAYERAMLGEQAGVEDMGDRWPLKAGGRVLVERGEWLVILRVNKANGRINSVTTTAPSGVTWSRQWKYGVEQIRDYREPSEDDAAKVKKATAKPPLCNYPGEGFRHITADEWARKNKDFKMTRDIAATDAHGAHRVRHAWFGGDVCKYEHVYITDQKRTDPPALATVTPKPTFERQVEPSELLCRQPQPEPEERDDFDAMEKALRQGVTVQVVSAPQLFPTPPELARRMVELADIGSADPFCRILEPSAGTGNLIAAIREQYKTPAVWAVELNVTMADTLRSRWDIPVVQGDFLSCDDLGGQFDRIIMNPPFSGGADVDHVRHAAELLKPGGVLVAVMCAGPFFRSDRKSAEFRSWLDDLDSEVIDLPADTFKASGTGVSTKLVVIRAESAAGEAAA